MRVSEIFYSLQGEGTLTGVPGVFVRLAGCPLRCRWCDSKYAWDKDKGTHYSIAGIIETVEQWHCRFVVITGGEPMMDSDLPELIRQLKARQKHVTVETAGIAFVPDLPCDLMSISPKLSNSTPNDPTLASIHEDSRLDTAVLAELVGNYQYQLKFVVDSPADLHEIEQTMAEIGNVDPGNVMLMPQAATRHELLAKSARLAEMCKSSGLAFCQRLQILLWNNERGR